MKYSVCTVHTYMLITPRPTSNILVPWQMMFLHMADPNEMAPVYSVPYSRFKMHQRFEQPSLFTFGVIKSIINTSLDCTVRLSGH